MKERKESVKLLTLPEDGISGLLKAIAGAKRSIEVAIFRFDRRDIEKALGAAVARGVSVQALIAHTNKAGEIGLRNLEARLLGAGVRVARTSSDFTRYHGKYMIIDRTHLYLLAFNFTSLDIDRSRSFGLITRNPALVREAVKLFDADSLRHPYEATLQALVVSPSNARKQLAAFVSKARRELLIYDVEISDPEMLKIIDARAAAGVEIRVIGKVKQAQTKLDIKRPALRLHTRTIIRDGDSAFIGSQSLRQMELDQRREVGVIFKDAKIAGALQKTFNADWKVATQSLETDTLNTTVQTEKAVKRVAKAVSKSLPSMTPLLKTLLQEMSPANNGNSLDPEAIEASVKSAVKKAVKAVVTEAVGEAVPQDETSAEESLE